MEETFSIDITCPSCKQVFVRRVDKKNAGKQLRCKCDHCGQGIRANIPLLTEKTHIDEELSDSHLKLFLSTEGDNPKTKPQSFQISADSTTIGRKPTNGETLADVEVVTADMTMSRIHAIIRKVKNIGFTISNPLGRTNGIFIGNESKLDGYTEVYLEDGDVIRMGETKFLVNIVRLSLNEGEVAME